MVLLQQAMWMLIFLAIHCEGQNVAPQLTSTNNPTIALPPPTGALTPEQPQPCTCEFECSHPRRACARCPVLTFEQLRNRESCLACIQRCFPGEVSNICQLQCQQSQSCPATEAIIYTVHNQHLLCRNCILQRCGLSANNRLLYARCMYAANVECRNCELSAYRISIRQQCDSCVYNCVSNPQPQPSYAQPQPNYPQPYSNFYQHYRQLIFQMPWLQQRPAYSVHSLHSFVENYQDSPRTGPNQNK